MAKQVLEIEVPDGKKAIWKDGRVVFEDVDTMESIKTINDAILFLMKNKIGDDILDSLSRLPKDLFEWKIAAYRAVVAAVTYNEQRHLTTGERWFPTIEFCRPGKVENCWGDIIVGRIKSEGEEFNVVGGCATYGSLAGLSGFNSFLGASGVGTDVSFRSVSSKKAALYISKQFGKLLFEVSYVVVQTVIGNGWKAEVYEHIHLGEITVYGNENTAGNFMASMAENLNPAFELLKSIPFKKTLNAIAGKEEVKKD